MKPHRPMGYIVKRHPFWGCNDMLITLSIRASLYISTCFILTSFFLFIFFFCYSCIISLWLATEKLCCLLCPLRDNTLCATPFLFHFIHRHIHSHISFYFDVTYFAVDIPSIWVRSRNTFFQFGFFFVTAIPPPAGVSVWETRWSGLLHKENSCKRSH